MTLLERRVGVEYVCVSVAFACIAAHMRPCVLTIALYIYIYIYSLF